uniref:MAM domain-containing protein n=1 Tax=Cyprinodon variegatus TaxID=28743 RepID=A0A3Q2DQA7_CYPVA
SSYSWRRQMANITSIPGQDHTIGTPWGNHYCYYIIACNHLNMSSSARLISFPQTAVQTICVSFHYYIFGNSIGSLKFITKHSGEPETVIWMRSGTQGNKWRFADLTFNSDRPIQGSIAIDDIKVFPSLNGLCPPERECTFQGSLCGMQPQPSADFSWNRITGMSQPANSSGPTKDHTLGTEQGYYLSAGLWNHPAGSKGAMTAAMEPTPLNGECLMFFYYMEGTGIGELNVYLQTTDSQENATKLWTRLGDQGSHWRHGRVTVYNEFWVLNHSLEIGFEDTFSNYDFSMRDGACAPAASCDFESGQCTWVNVQKEDGHEWVMHSGSTANPNTGPDSDHTTNTPSGHYYFLPSSIDEQAGQKALMYSPLYPESEKYLKWTKTGNKGDQWLEDSVTVQHEHDFWVINICILKYV